MAIGDPPERLPGTANYAQVEGLKAEAESIQKSDLKSAAEIQVGDEDRAASAARPVVMVVMVVEASGTIAKHVGMNRDMSFAAMAKDKALAPRSAVRNLGLTQR